jgi:outer membrane receptor protein involved in Fe transport
MAAAAIAGAPVHARAQAQGQAQVQGPRVVHVPAGPASEGIAELARQTDLQILAPEADLRGARTNAVHGRYEPREALRRMLAGTSLRMSDESGRVITVRRAPRFAFGARRPAPVQPDAPPPPPPVRIVAAPPLSVVEEVVITGSLLVRNGADAPTPVTVVEAGVLQQSAPSNLPDGLNQLPQFSGSRSESQNNQTGTAISPTAGNYLNLRNLGFVRSLVLLDGQRFPPTSYEGMVDTNVIPQALVQRIDVVTAGASATYGSDALTGVVNFVLDKKFTGLKASAQAGISNQGDNGGYRLTLAGGAPALDDRAHLLFSLEHYQSNGIKDRADRPYMALGAIAFGNGATIPYDIRYGARVANSTFGGLILSGPLTNWKFEPGGTITPFDRGSAQIAGVQIGGDGSETVLGSLVGSIRTEQAFARGSYDFAENLTGFVQATFGESRNRYAHVGADSRFGNMTIFSGNAFLRPEIQSALTASNTPGFTFSRHSLESGRKVVDTLNDSVSLFAGLEGRARGEWRWRATYAGGQAIMRMAHSRNPENTRLTAALDAVRDPATGQIVCRVTLTDPGRYPGCVPVDFFGVGAPSRAALEYIYGQTSQYQVRNDLHDFALTANGPLAQWPAGLVRGAIGAEWRTQSLKMASNADPAVPIDTTGLRGFPTGQGRFGNTNQGVAAGSQDVRELFGEIVVPLLKALPAVESAEFNGAVRLTDYSTSGRVETWKAGLSYVPVEGLRLRATASRDIRAPTLYELFAGESLNAGTFNDVHTGRTVVLTQIRSGNLNLTPEIGRTTTIGVVYEPLWLAGFSAAVDYYAIDIKGAISSRTPTQINQDCEDTSGVSPSCALIVRPLPFSDRSPANAVQRMLLAPQNQAQTYTHGVDLDAGYRFPLGQLIEDSGAMITLRALANYAPSFKTRETTTSPVQQQAGLGGNASLSTGQPKLRATLSANWREGPLTINLQQRFIGGMERSLQPDVRYVQNQIPAVRYYNLAIAWRFPAAGRDLEAFVNVNNLFDQRPPLVPFIDQPGLRYPTLQQIYDVIGRAYTVGVRANF